jgi:hypothetical protein
LWRRKSKPKKKKAKLKMVREPVLVVLKDVQMVRGGGTIINRFTKGAKE